LRKAIGRTIDHQFERRHRLQRPVAAHRPGRHCRRGEYHRGHIDLRNIVDADRSGRGHQADAGGIVGQPTAFAGQIGRVGDKLPRPSIDAEFACDLKGMALETGLELFETVIGQANRFVCGKETSHGDIKREDRMIAAAEAAADRGAMRNDVFHMQIAASVADQLGDRRCRILG
jgi:hypothetical protein